MPPEPRDMDRKEGEKVSEVNPKNHGEMIKQEEVVEEDDSRSPGFVVIEKQKTVNKVTKFCNKGLC